MESSITITGSEAVIAKLKGLDDEARKRFRKAMVLAQNGLVNRIKSNLGRGGMLRTRSGALRNSIVAEEIKEDLLGGMTARVGSNLVYARPQEYGASISAKNAANLTIPLRAALTGNGVLRWSARDIISNPGAGGYDGTFFRRGVLFGKKGLKVTPLFALKPSVVLAEIAFMRTSLLQEKPLIQARFAKALAEVLHA